jgi:hypothetical protein
MSRHARAVAPRSVIEALVALVALVTAAGCGGGSGSGPIPFDALGAKVVPAACKQLVACGDLPDEATCEAWLRIQTSEFETLKTDIASGKVIYDPVAAGKCIGLLDMITSCTRTVARPLAEQSTAACNAVFTGTVAPGAACFFSAECANGTCAKTGCSAACCAGACVATPAPIPVGGDCSAPLPNQSCASGSICSIDAVTGVGTCVVPPSAVGAACTNDVGCDPTLYCNADPVTGSGTCQRGAATGATCNPALGSLSCDDLRDTCDITTGRCTPPTPVGMACDPTSPSGCVGYASCDSATSTCLAKLRLGQACSTTTGLSCLAGLTCDPTTLTCTSTDPPGPSCS